MKHSPIGGYQCGMHNCKLLALNLSTFGRYHILISDCIWMIADRKSSYNFQHFSILHICIYINKYFIL